MTEILSAVGTFFQSAFETVGTWFDNLFDWIKSLFRQVGLGGHVCYYGCPNSKRVEKLQLKNKKYKKIRNEIKTEE